jgi:hypothetical protein
MRGATTTEGGRARHPQARRVLSGLASILGLDAAALERSAARWNSLCEHGRDDDFGRPPGSMMRIAAPPFYGAPVWATVSNT